MTNENTQITASNTLSITSGRDTNLVGADVSGNTVDANVGRNLTITSPQDTNTYNSQQSSAGFQASICVPPICYGTTVSGSVSVSDQKIKDNFQSVNQQSGIYAGTGGYDVNVGNHTQLNGGVIASTASADKNSLSTQTFGFTNLQNVAQSSGSTIGFSASAGAGKSTANGVSFTPPAQTGSSTSGAQNSQGQGPLGFGVAGTSSSASGTTYAAVSPGTITVRGDAGTGKDSTAGLSRDTANANGSVQNTFNAQNVANDMAIQQVAGQVGMQVVGNVATALENKANAAVAKDKLALDAANASGDPASIAQATANLDSDQQQAALWDNDGAARIGSHAAVAALGAALGGGSVAGAIGGTVAGDVAGNWVNSAMAGNPTLAGTLLSNIASAAAGAIAGGALGGPAGALSGANGASSADLYNRQLHQSEKARLQQAANAIAASIGQNPADQATIAQYWNSMLTLAANADVDTQAQQQLTQYKAQLTQAAQLSGNYQPLDTFTQNLQTAEGIVQSMRGQTLVGTTGNPIVADGSVVNSFQSTTAQANDTGLFGGGPLGGMDTKTALGPGNTLATVNWDYAGNGTVQQQILAMEQNSLQQTSAPKDAVTPVYPVEQLGLAYMTGGLTSGAIEAIAARIAATGSTGFAASGAAADVANITTPVTSNGTANAATVRQLAADLTIAQSKDPLIGTTLTGASAPVQVTADASIGGQSFFDVNQTARAAGLPNAEQPTLISDLVAPGDPNGTYGAAHAEIGVIQQAYDAGLTQNQSMTIVVRGQEACSYCRSDLADMAEAAGLNRLTVVNGTDGSVLQWTKGTTSGLVQIKNPL